MTADVIQMGSTAGWVYILTQPAAPGYVKVGRTQRDPAARAAELHDTGSPLPYQVAAAFEVADVVAGERAAHGALARWRTAPDREWFRIGVARAARKVAKAVGHRARRPRRERGLIGYGWRIIRGLVEVLGWLLLLAVLLSSLPSS